MNRRDLDPNPDSDGALDAAGAAVRRAHLWFERNSGWAPPDVDTLSEWTEDGMCRAPDECLTTPEGWCSHGLASWKLILDALD